MTALLCAVVTTVTNITAASAFELKMPTRLHAPRRIAAPSYTPEILLVMPKKGLKDDDLKETMDEVHGTVIGSIGEGDLKCYIVKTEKGHFEETEKKLTKDCKHFSTISRNYRIPANRVPDAGRDPQFTAQWHLQALHCPDAWNTATGSGVRIAVFDSGCSASNPDLAGKTDKGFDAYGAVGKILGVVGHLPAFMVPGTTELAGMAAGLLAGGADSDHGANSHGSNVATTIAATMNNATAGVGVAPDARIYPVRIAENKNPLKEQSMYTTDLELMAGMIHIMSKPDIRIINISYNVPVVGFHNAKVHPALHVYFQKFFLKRSGLIFISAGNDSFPDPTPPVYYLNVISGVNQQGKLVDFSNYGPAIAFTGPAVNIGCSDKQGNAETPDGTSFSCPIVAAIAALILDKKPFAPNVEVLNALRKSCKNIGGVPGFNMYYGWGMPDAYAAVTGSDHPPAGNFDGKSPPSFNVASGQAARRTGTGAAGVVYAGH